MTYRKKHSTCYDLLVFHKYFFIFKEQKIKQYEKDTICFSTGIYI